MSDRKECGILKRKRDLLVELVTNHFTIIENKKTDAVSVKAKNEEWRKLAEGYNSATSSIPREWSTLKTLWENLKRKAKLALAERNQNFKGTGGGKASRKFANDPLIDSVVALIRPHVEAFSNPYDDNESTGPSADTERGNVSSEEELAHEHAIDENSVIARKPLQLARGIPSPVIELDDGDDIPTLDHNEVIPDKPILDWSKYMPAHLKTPVSASLFSSRQSAAPSTSRRRPQLKHAAAEAVTAAKVASLELATREATEEHRVQMRILALQELQEAEKLKREKLQTELLKIQLEKETGSVWDVDVPTGDLDENYD